MGQGLILTIQVATFLATLDAHAPISTTFRTDIPLAPTLPASPPDNNGGPSSAFSYQFGDDSLPNPHAYDYHQQQQQHLPPVAPVADIAKHGHVAPSHTRFVMPEGLRRPGTTSRREDGRKKKKPKKVEKEE